MAWREEMTELVRSMVVDFGTPPRSSDANIQRVLVTAARLVLCELDFSRDYTADVVNREIVPDPTDDAGGTRDDGFVNLVCMRAAAIIDAGSARGESGIVVRDNGSTVDLHYKLQAALALVKDGWQKRYDQEKAEYQMGILSGSVPGQAVMSSFRDIAAEYYHPEDGRSDRTCRYYE